MRMNFGYRQRPATAAVILLTGILSLPAAQHEHQWTIQGSYSILPTEPLEIGHERQLLMDDHVVEDVRAVRRKVHQPKKHPANPLFSTGTADLNPDTTVTYVSVLRDQDSGLYRLWDSSSVLVEIPTPPGFYWLSRARYYESKDGLQWTAPKLGLVEVDGTKANNVFKGSDKVSFDSVGVIRTPPRWRDQGRYLMIYNLAPAGRDPHPELIAGGQELRVAFSDDGVHWTDQKENPIFRGQSDTANNLTYNPERGVVMYYRRPPINAGEIRRIAYSESSDLLTWSQPEHVVVPDELDPYSLYCMPVVRYQGMYLGFLHMFYLRPPFQREGEVEKKLKIDVQLAWSRDGRNWERHPERPIFLETGPAGSYDRGRVYIAKGLIEHEDRVDLYYTGHESLHISREVRPGDGHICLASLRRDGFVSLAAADQGSMLTRPIRHPGGRLRINAKTEPTGSIRVAVRRGDGERDGLRFDEWSRDRCRSFSGDSTNHAVAWEGTTDPASLKDQAIRLEFHLEKAELYSFWFE